jgi:hypothetical protein
MECDEKSLREIRECVGHGFVNGCVGGEGKAKQCNAGLSLRDV